VVEVLRVNSYVVSVELWEGTAFPQFQKLHWWQLDYGRAMQMVAGPVQISPGATDATGHRWSPPLDSSLQFPQQCGPGGLAPAPPLVYGTQAPLYLLLSPGQSCVPCKSPWLVQARGGRSAHL
jgi:hypothetical protein